MLPWTSVGESTSFSLACVCGCPNVFTLAKTRWFVLPPRGAVNCRAHVGGHPTQGSEAHALPQSARSRSLRPRLSAALRRQLPHAEPDHDPYAGARVGEASHPGPYRRPKRREPGLGLGLGLDALRPLSCSSSSASSSRTWAVIASMPGALIRDALGTKSTKVAASANQFRRALESWRPRSPLVTPNPPPSPSYPAAEAECGSPSKSGNRHLATSIRGLGRPSLYTTSALKPSNLPPTSFEPLCCAPLTSKPQ